MTTNIQWTEETWNPITGCSVVSPGCTNCYAMKAAWRMSDNPTTPQYHGTVRKVNNKPVWTGKLGFSDKALIKPMKTRKPTLWFVNSMGDLFHEDCPDEWIDQVFAVMALCPQHRFQVLTKRSARMHDYVSDIRTPGRITAEQIRWTYEQFHAGKNDFGAVHYRDDAWFIDWPLPNVWLGVSAEDQARADQRIPYLLKTPAALRFVSAEPLLGPIDLTGIRSPEVWGPNPGGWTFDAFTTGDYYTLHSDGLSESGDGPYRDYALDWVIIGGESGPSARPMHLEHARALKQQCEAAGVPVFVKQLGRQCIMPRTDAVQPCALGAGWDALSPSDPMGTVTFVDPKGGKPVEWPADMRVQEMPREAE